MKKTFRSFIAVPLPGRIKKHLTRIQQNLRRAGIKASWPRPEAMHLTLKFLGDIRIADISGIQACMKQAVKDFDVFDLSISGLGGFPSRDRARVIWAGVGGQKEVLVSLARELENGLAEQLNIRKEKKAYSPHLTLARVKRRPIDLRGVETGENSSGMFCISELILYESTLLPSGAKHEKIFSAKI